MLELSLRTLLGILLTNNTSLTDFNAIRNIRLCNSELLYTLTTFWRCSSTFVTEALASHCLLSPSPPPSCAPSVTLPSHRLPQYHLPSLLNPPDVERSLHFSSFPAGLEPRFPYNTDKHFPSSSHSKYYTHPASYTPSTRLPFSPSTNNHRPSLERSHLSVLPAMACGHPALLSIPDQALRPTPFTAFLRVC